MTKLILLSDNHGDSQVMIDILKKEEYDVSVHLGDSQLSEDFMKKNFTYYVQGNHDTYLPKDQLFEIEGNKIIIGHGHYFFGAFDIMHPEKSAAKFAEANGANIVIFGHSHKPCNKKINNIICVNPGSCALPRNPEGKSYALMTIDNNDVSVEIKYF